MMEQWRYELYHSAKGSTWKKHKYTKIVNGVYYYPSDYNKIHDTKKLLKDNKASGKRHAAKAVFAGAKSLLSSKLSKSYSQSQANKFREETHLYSRSLRTGRNLASSLSRTQARVNGYQGRARNYERAVTGHESQSRPVLSTAKPKSAISQALSNIGSKVASTATSFAEKGKAIASRILDRLSGKH